MQKYYCKECKYDYSDPSEDKKCSVCGDTVKMMNALQTNRDKIQLEREIRESFNKEM